MTSTPNANPNPPASNQQQAGSSLASRLKASNQAAPQTNNGTAATASNSPFSSPPRPPAPRFGSTQNNNQRSWVMQPLQKTVVRFDLRGLGDPFYRLLGHELNPEFGDYRKVTAVLERGGEVVRDLENLLNRVWEGYRLQGAILVYNWNADSWKTIATPPAPAPSEDEDENGLPAAAPPPPVTFTCLRSIDLQLILNVLARSRSQVLLTRAPLVFSQQYLNRAVITDDPRLVNLVKATGYLEDEPVR